MTSVKTARVCQRSAKSAPAATIWVASTRRDNFKTAFYRSPLTDNNSYEQWLAEGEKRIEQRANEQVRKWLSDYKGPRRWTQPSTRSFRTSSG